MDYQGSSDIWTKGGIYNQVTFKIRAIKSQFKRYRVTVKVRRESELESQCECVESDTDGGRWSSPQLKGKSALSVCHERRKSRSEVIPSDT